MPLQPFPFRLLRTSNERERKTLAESTGIPDGMYTVDGVDSVDGVVQLAPRPSHFNG